MATEDVIEVQCPWCGEWTEILVPFDQWGEMIQDCEVCCRPWRLEVTRDDWGDPDVRVDRLD